MKLDHLVWASNSLENAAAEFERLSGVVAGSGGRHLTIGSRNALTSLENEAYLAIDGPDPLQEPADNYGAFLANLTSPVLWRFAVQTPDLAPARGILARHGFETSVKPGSRTTSGGRLLEWDTLTVAGHDFDLGMPIIKTWRTDGHPSSEAPGGCRLISLIVSHPRATDLKRLYEELDVPVGVVEHPVASLTAVIEGQFGRFTLPAA
ncbi:VOC family protein [Rhizobium sp. 0TCS1.26]|uniref:VOC family protein n=1 Tax=Rhizobium sp. 0TCS1.26 TaxID=3142623 RepID=UPI003D285380